MPDAALPAPLPERAASTVPFRRTYKDALGRPLSGGLQATPIELVSSDQMILPVPVPLWLHNGTAAADLPPGVYLLSGILRTPERQAVVVNERAEVG